METLENDIKEAKKYAHSKLNFDSDKSNNNNSNNNNHSDLDRFIYNKTNKEDRLLNHNHSLISETKRVKITPKHNTE